MQPAVALIGYLDQDNLGIGYLASMLQREGFRPIIIDYRMAPERIGEAILRNAPVAVGFSLIFQYFTSDFGVLMRNLREQGVSCHFTVGGFYPSLRPREVMEALPELDSVVRSEGEYTLVELARALASGSEWVGIAGIASRGNGGIRENALRPLETDLDRFPIPIRRPVLSESLGMKEATLVASRGCYYNCSFCSIREFYSAARGPLRRVRSAERVVEEMGLLHEEMGCRIFLFQDDDFPGAAKNGQAWAARFCELLRERGLAGKVLWKISCRADEIDERRFGLLRDAGLFLVYLGIESGTDDGLKLMNKRMGAEVNLAAVQKLRQAGLACDFGFMLFDPFSDARSVRENLHFLDSICADGYTPITACKMIPYSGTAIEAMLARDGRLKVLREHEDYDFLDDGLNELYRWFVRTFADWMQSAEGMLALSRAVRYRLAIRRRFGIGPCEELAGLEAAATETIGAANRLFTAAVREAVTVCEGPPSRSVARLARIQQGVRQFESSLAPRLRELAEQSGRVTTGPSRSLLPFLLTI